MDAVVADIGHIIQAKLLPLGVDDAAEGVGRRVLRVSRPKDLPSEVLPF